MNLEDQARELAEKFRTENRLGLQPLGDLVALIEQTTGYGVAVIDTQNGEHGLTMRDPVRGKVFIAVARSTKPMRQRSSLAHELGHVLFEDWGNDLKFDVRSPEEIRADAFARHLLVPVEGVRQLLGHKAVAGEAQLSEVVQRYVVSPAIAAIALRDAGYIDAGQSTAWRKIRTPELATRHGWRDQYAALQQDANQTRSPQKLLSRSILGYAKGLVSDQAIATLRGIPVEQASMELDEAGITPELLSSDEVRVADLPAAR